MPHIFDTRKKHQLLSEERQEALQPEKLLRQIGLAEGDTIADIGCGPGFFTVPAARIVGDTGKVYAADMQGEMLSAVQGRVHELELSNVRVMKTSESDVPIPAESCEYILLAFVLNEIRNRSTFLHRLARILKPGGKFIILEWEKVAQEAGPPVEDRVSQEELTADAVAAGLSVGEKRDVAEHQYLLLAVPATRG